MPLSSPADPILVASVAQLAALEATGRYAITHDGYAALAGRAWDLHAVLYALQSDGVRGSDAIDLDQIEDLAVLLEALRAEPARTDRAAKHP